MNLISEYRRRHRTQCVPVCHDGLCFFSDPDGVTDVVALTSLPCRSFSTCPSCDTSTGSVIVEVFYSDVGGTFSQAAHEHVHPSTDLARHIADLGHHRHVPFAARSSEELESWLWRFITKSLKLRTPPKGETSATSEIIHAALKKPRVFNSYYMAYEAFLLGRKYLLLD